MVKAWLHILGGYRTVSVPGECSVQLLNILCGGAYSHWRIQNEADGGISFRLTVRDADALQRACSKLNIPLTVGEAKGFPALFRRYRQRWGILLGTLIFVWITALSCCVVWDVEVTGNEKFDDEQIVHMLADYGFGAGSFFKKIDFDVLQNEFLLTTDEIAWISVNMVGTVAHVQVRENLGGSQSGDGSAGVANVIAKEDGQITEVQIRAGKAAVAINDVVRKGELLISGVIAIGEDGLRYEHASGSVLARVNRQITVEIPKNGLQKVYTGEEFVRKSIIFFGKEIKLFGKSSIDNPTYDTILSEKNFSLPGGVALPVQIREEKDRVYVMEPHPLSDSQAYVEAMMKYREELDGLLIDAEIVSAELSHYEDENVYRITAHLVCVSDIAATAPIASS